VVRRGGYSHVPRTAPNLANTILSIAREMAAAQDRNIMDAWKNGGVFDGKPATDKTVLSYWRGRLDDVDPQDPLYDTYKNTVMQLEYGIEQSKQDLLYTQGKLSDGQYAQFFINWAKKVPRDSEFWRVLQKDAAQLMERARASGAAASKRRKTESFNAFVADTTEKDIAIADAMTNALDGLSKSTGLNITGNGPQLLATLTQDFALHPEQYRVLDDALTAGDVEFSGTFTSAYFGRALDSATTGYGLIADRAKQDGFSSVYDSAAKNEAQMSQWGQNFDVWPVAKSYDAAYKQYSRIWGDANASWADRQDAATKFAQVVQKLAATPGIDAASVTMLQADATRLLGQDAGDAPSFGQAMLGRGGVTPEVAAAVGYIDSQQALKDANPGSYVNAPVNADGSFDPTGQGPVGIIPAGSLPAGAQFVAVPGLTGKASVIAVMPHSVYAVDPNDPNATPVEVAKTLSYRNGDEMITLTGYADSRNNEHWGESTPWADGVTSAVDKNGDTYLTLPGGATQDPLTRAAALDKQYGTHLVDQIKAGSVNPTAVIYQRDKNNRITAKITAKLDKGSFSMTQTTMVRDANGQQMEGSTTPLSLGVPAADLFKAAISPSRDAAGDVPGVTFLSPMQAAMDAAGSRMQAGQIALLASDPLFQSAFISQTMQTLGIQDPTDPRVVAAWTDSVVRPVKDFNTGVVAEAKRMQAFERRDLEYPGAPKQVSGQAAPSISMGATLKVPTIPAALLSQLPLPGTTDFGGGRSRGGSWGPAGSALAPVPVAQAPIAQAPIVPMAAPTIAPLMPTVMPTVTTIPNAVVSPLSSVIRPPGRGPLA